MARIISRSVVFRLLTCIVLVASACAPKADTGSQADPGPTPASTPSEAMVRIVVLGDSLAAGLGLAEADAFPAVVERLLRDRGYPVEIVNAGVSGDTSAGGLQRVDWVLQHATDILVVELGGNDALRGQELSYTESNLREIVRRGRARGAEVVLLGMDVPTNYGPDYSRAFSQMYTRIADEEGAILVPGFVREVGVDPSLLQPDGLHPTVEGQRLLAETLIPYIETMLATTGPSEEPDA